jgi:hypothetical protein
MSLAFHKSAFLIGSWPFHSEINSVIYPLQNIMAIGCTFFYLNLLGRVWQPENYNCRLARFK